MSDTEYITTHRQKDRPTLEELINSGIVTGEFKASVPYHPNFLDIFGRYCFNRVVKYAAANKDAQKAKEVVDLIYLITIIGNLIDHLFDKDEKMRTSTPELNAVNMDDAYIQKLFYVRMESLKISPENVLVSDLGWNSNQFSLLESCLNYHIPFPAYMLGFGVFNTSFIGSIFPVFDRSIEWVEEMCYGIPKIHKRNKPKLKFKEVIDKVLNTYYS